MRIVVLGGASKMGCITVQDLVNDPRVDEVVIADLDFAPVLQLAEYLDSPKVRLEKVDIKQPSFIALLDGAGACVNAANRHTNLRVMQACLQAGVHYTDLGGLFFITREQLKLHDAFVESGLSAVLGMSSTPGISNVQARYAADRLDTIEKIHIYDGIKTSQPGSVNFAYSVSTILDELALNPLVFEDGAFVAKLPLTGREDYWFTAPIGTLPTHLSLHSEIATLPVSFAGKGVNHCSYKINSWGLAQETVEKIRELTELGLVKRRSVQVNGQKVVHQSLLETLLAADRLPIDTYLAPSANQPPDWTREIATEVHGAKDGKPLIYRLGTLTCKRAQPTGTAPAITAIWLAAGYIPPGVYPPEAVIKPVPFFNELKTRGIFTQVAATEML